MSAATQTLHELCHCLLRLVGPPQERARGEDLAALVQRLDQLRDQLGTQAPAMLRHYLERRSYAKALELLEGRDGKSTPGC
ncbi:MAG: hypothetical protein AB1505_12100 [Candidatus Latescibacterota bacterium]